MIAATLRAAGFALELTSENRVRVMPASRLTGEHRALVRDHVDELRAELGAEAAASDGVGTDRDPARWLRFRALCIGAGVTVAELAERLPGVEDREDIACSADDSLEALAEHLARAVLSERPVRAADALWRIVDGIADDPRARTVTCGACASFVRVVGRPHDGHCAANSPDVRSAILWDDTERACGRFEAVA